MARTIVDLIRTGMSSEHVKPAIAQALERGMVTRAELQAEGAARSGRVASVIEAGLEEGGTR